MHGPVSAPAASVSAGASGPSQAERVGRGGGLPSLLQHGKSVAAAGSLWEPSSLVKAFGRPIDERETNGNTQKKWLRENAPKKIVAQHRRLGVHRSSMAAEKAESPAHIYRESQIGTSLAEALRDVISKHQVPQELFDETMDHFDLVRRMCTWAAVGPGAGRLSRLSPPNTLAGDELSPRTGAWPSIVSQRAHPLVSR